jgi:PAS domain S-box-containing protein
LTGYDHDEMVGRNCRFLQGADADEASVAGVRAAIDDRKPVTVEFRNYRKDGTEFWNRVSIAPILNDDGTLRNFISF